jgi:branched-chain amino acid transport system permease protein
MASLLLEAIIFHKLRQRRASPLVALLASLGGFIVIQNLLSLLAGDGTKVISPGPVAEGWVISIPLMGSARISSVQGLTMVATLGLGVGVSLLVTFASRGKQIRAVANDPELAQVVGINSNGIHLLVHAIGGALGGVAALCMALEEGFTPTMGFRIFLKVGAAMIIGGAGSLPGVVFGGLAIGLLETLSVTILDQKWQDALVFVVLLAFLFGKPEGLVGKRRS